MDSFQIGSEGRVSCAMFNLSDLHKFGKFYLNKYAKCYVVQAPTNAKIDKSKNSKCDYYNNNNNIP